MAWKFVNVEDSDYTWVEIIAVIRKNETGEIREYVTSAILEDDNTIFTFGWCEGNYSCDCNRNLFFLRANNEDEEEAWEYDNCSEGEYSVQLLNSVDRSMLYKEF